MKRIALIGDLHIKHTTEWDINRLYLLSKHIKSQKPNEVYILGDLFDNNHPTTKVLKYTKEFIDSLGVPVSYINGNHERINSSEDYILDDLSPLLGIKYLLANQDILGVNIKAVGHNNLWTLKDTEIYGDILLSHFRWSHSLYGKGELSGRENSLCKNFKDIILSDIHYKYNPRKNVTYTSSPYSVKVSRGNDYGYIMLEVVGGVIGWRIQHIKTDFPKHIKYTTSLLKLPKLLRTISNEDKVTIEVEMTSLKDLPKVVPHNVTIEPLITKESKKVQEAKKTTIKSTILNTLISVLPKDIIPNVDYIKKVINNKGSNNDH